MSGIKIQYEVNDGGSTGKLISATGLLKKDLDSVAASATRAGVAVKAAMQPTGGSKTKDALQAATGLFSDRADYNQAKGIAGATGAAGRDFAKQAQGLGGLVHTYATFAANIFAVSAAFTALKEAAQTDNLIKGLDTLGAASGRNLGTISKRLVEATDGAISLRDAMTATAQASSAGMTAKNMERLAVVAKNTSIALGISMTDALSRLSRGITKLEPELLDELGLFTKIGPATEKYALQLGKATSQLTDFERRQAFANAVLEEGEQKFNSLSSSGANAYDKLLATAKNATQEILSSINKLLEPIANFLANNPVMVALGTIAIASSLLKKALPSLMTDYSGLQAANEKALETQQKTIEASKKVQAQQLLEKTAAEQSLLTATKLADAKLAEADAAEAAASRIKESKQRAAKLDQILGTSTGYADISKDQLKALRDEADKFDGKNKKAAVSYRELATAIEQYQVALASEAASTESARSATDKLALSKQRLTALEREIQGTQAALGLSSAKLAAATVLQEQGILGLASAIGILNAKMKELGVTQGQRLGESAKFFGGALLGGLGKLLTGLNYATLAWTGLTLVADLGASMFSKNAKQMEAFSKATQTAADSADNASRTIDTLSKKGGFASGTIEGVAAMSNAFTELADAAASAIDTAAKAQRSLDLSWWDRMANNVNKVFGSDISSKEAKVLGDQIENASKIMRKMPGGNEAGNKLKSMLGVTSLDAVSATEAFKKLDEISKGKVIAYLKEFGVELGAASQYLNNFKTSTDTAYKAYQEFLQSTASSNPLLKLGQTLDLVAKSMTDIFDAADTSKMMSAMDDLTKNAEKAALFGPKFAEGLVSIRTEFKEAAKEVKGLRDREADVTAEIEKQQAILDREVRKHPVLADPKAAKTQATPAFMKASEEINKLQQESKELKGALTNATERSDQVFKRATNLFVEGLDSAFEKGAEYVVTALGQAQEKAALALARAKVGTLSGEIQARELAKLNQKDFDIQLRAIDTNISLIKIQEELNATINESNALATRANLGPSASQISRDNAAAAVGAAKAYKEFIKDGKTAREDIDAKVKSSELTGLAASLFKSLAQGTSAKLAAQGAARTEVVGKATAQAETDKQAISKAAVADRQRELSFVTAINQQELARFGIVNSIVGSAYKASVLEQDALEKANLAIKIKNETLDIDNRIALADDKQEKAKLRTEKSLMGIRQEQEIYNQGLQTAQRLLQIEIGLITKRYEAQKLSRDTTFAAQEAELELSKARLNSDTQLGRFSESYARQKQFDLDTNSAALANIKARTDAIAVYNAEDEKARKRILELEKQAGDDPLGADPAKIAEVNHELDRQKAIRDAAISQADIQLNKQKELLSITKALGDEQQRYNDITKVSTDLTSSLKNVFGDVGEKLGNIATSMGEFVVNQEKSTKAQAALNKKIADAEEDPLGVDPKLYAERQKLQKDSLKQELSGYGQLAGAAKTMFKEKTLAYKALAAVEKTMHIARLVMDAKEMASKLFTTATTTTAAAAGETAKTGFTVAGFFARLPTFIAETFFSVTGQLGVFGPAVAAGIVASILAMVGGGKGGSMPTNFTSESQQKVQGTGLTYDSSGNLVQRAGGVTGDATAVANSVKSSIEGLSKDFFNLFGSSSSSNIVKSLYKIEDNTGNMVKAFLGKLVGFGSASQFGTVESSSKILGGIWGSSSTTIADVGVQVKGFLQNLSEGVGTFQQYENVIRKSSSWFGLSKSTSYYTNLGSLPESAQKALQDIFANVGIVLTESAAALEGNATRVNDLLDQIPIDFKVSLKGLSGEDAAKAIMAEVSVQLNAAAEKVFPYLEKYNKIGEEMYQTVARIVKEGEVLNQGLTMIGKTLTGITAEVTVAFQQDLITKAGGVDKFATSIQYYFDNFISAQKRYEVSFSALNKQFKDAGMSMPKSKQAYMDLVDRADTATEIGRQQLATLITLSEQYNNLLDAQAEAYKDQINTLDDTITKFRDFAKTLNDFKSSLVLSASSTATPLEKYAEAKTQFESTYALALSGDKDAMSKLTNISQTFLDMSKQLFASSDAYTKDFNTVLDKINAASISASASADVAQLQLDAINTQVGLLSSINDNIALIAGVPAKAGGGRVSGLTLVGELGPELVDFSTPGRVYTADQTAGMFTSGGGMAPAIGAMVAEIQQLREEVALLRKDQQKQTGDLIISNYDANQKAAEEVATAVTAASADSTWTQRSKSEIK